MDMDVLAVVQEKFMPIRATTARLFEYSFELRAFVLSSESAILPIGRKEDVPALRAPLDGRWRDAMLGYNASFVDSQPVGNADPSTGTDSYPWQLRSAGCLN